MSVGGSRDVGTQVVVVEVQEKWQSEKNKE